MAYLIFILDFGSGSLTLFIAALSVAIAISYAGVDAAGECPLPSKVYSCSPKCKENYECTNGKVCCSNSCNAKSCSVPATAGTGTGSSGTHASGGTAVYCDNVKCNAHEVCKMDPKTKRNKCSRA